MSSHFLVKHLSRIFWWINRLPRLTALFFLLQSFVAPAALACAGFPSGVQADDRIMEFLPASGVYRDRLRGLLTTATEGTLVFDRNTQQLQICDGTSWVAQNYGTSPAGSTTNTLTMTWGGGGGNLTSLISRGIPSSQIEGTWRWRQISLGHSHTCGIRASDDRLFCWGANGQGRLGDGTTTHRNAPTALASTGGWDTTAFKSVSTGGNYTCGIRASDDRVFCWGNNFYGQLGDGTTTDRNVPTALALTGGWDTTAFKSVDAGQYHTCGIRASDDRVFCWGMNHGGRLGDGRPPSSYWQSEVPVGLIMTDGSVAPAFKSVSVSGGDHACGVRASDDRVFCWGDNGHGGQLGDGTTTNRPVPTALTSSDGWDTTTAFKLLGEGGHTCGIRASDNRIFCWGRNASGQLGDGNVTDRYVPTALTYTDGWEATAFKSVSAGHNHTCGIRASDERLFCWGLNSYGQLGDGTTTDRNVPTALASTGGWDTTAFLSATTGGNHTCGIRASDDRVFCWGSNAHGQVGDGTTTSRPVPTALTSTGGWDTTAFKSVSTGLNHTCGIRASDERLFCWGRNSSGQLGDGTTISRSDPTALTSTDGWDATAFKSVSLGSTHTCGVRASDDRVFCWGFNGNGRLGDSTTTDRSVPGALTLTGGWDTTAFKSVSLGDAHTCGIRASDDRLFCWGNNANGRLGDGTTTARSVPTALTATGGWNAIAFKSVNLGTAHTCGIRASDDLLYCWGNNVNGRLGDGTTINRSAPTALTATGGWATTAFKSVSLGTAHTCGIRATDDRLFCWGNNTNGQLGDGTTTDRTVPTALSPTAGGDFLRWSAVEAGGNFTVGLLSTNNPWPSGFILPGSASEIAVQMIQPSQGAPPRILSLDYQGGGLAGSFTINSTAPRTLLVATTEGLWRLLTSVDTTNSCEHSYANGGDARVIMFLPNGGSLTQLSSRLQSPIPRQGFLTYNSGLKRLQVCDGSTWYTLGQ